MSRGAKYFAVDTAPTDSLPPSPVLRATHRVGEFAQPSPWAAYDTEHRL